jgi:transcriptional regulator with PAS, ATPase and Fis domain
VQTKKIAQEVAKTNSTVLLLGESGTGKELFAQAVHNDSNRRGAFIAVNCSAIPRSLVESELFGYEAGTFTGANRNGRPGKFERAHNGTIFLDEIGDMPLDLQAVLLRVLQEREVVRVGGFKPIPVNVRVIAATNQDLLEKVVEGNFREDLYYRLNVIALKIPPLRERKDDIPLLVKELLPQICARMNKQLLRVSPAVMQNLQKYDWPGNVRELENALERSTVIAKGNEIEMIDLSEHLNNATSMNLNNMSLQDIEKVRIEQAIATQRTVEDAAKILGISRSTLYRKMTALEIQKVRS